MKRRIVRGINLFFWLLLLGGGLAAYDAYRFLTTPASQTPEEFVFTIEPGATFDRVAWDLKKAGVITDVPRFRILAYGKNALGKVRAGEYMVNTGWLPEQALWQITQGQALLYRLTLREGLTWWETARAVEEQGFAVFEDFKSVIHDPAFLREHHIPFANAEGFLYPETYLLKKPRSPLDREQAHAVASLMIRTFWKKTEPLWTDLLPGPHSPDTAPIREEDATTAQKITDNSAAQPLVEQAGSSEGTDARPAEKETKALPGSLPAPRTPAEVEPEALRRLLILASLVEKETGVSSERGRVAGVYANRLRLGMLLQCDPTIIYGIGEKFTHPIRRSQLDDAGNSYNTYQQPGLPPGPICSSGLEALKAAVNPEEHDYLYFVATVADDGHTFSKTLEQHNRAVKLYRARVRGRAIE